MTTVLPPVREALAALDACALDAALLPVEAVAARFAARDLCEAAFVVVTRLGHPLGPAPSLAASCAARHLVVSRSDDAHGHVDLVLREHGGAWRRPCRTSCRR